MWLIVWTCVGQDKGRTTHEHILGCGVMKSYTGIPTGRLPLYFNRKAPGRSLLDWCHNEKLYSKNLLHSMLKDTVTLALVYGVIFMDGWL